jgi:hypothetical protein
MVKIEIGTRHLSDVSNRGFVLTFKHWMGRLFSTCAHLSLHLYQLIHKINDTSQPIIDEANKEKSQTPSKERNVTPQTPSSNKDKIIPLPPSYVDKETQVSPPSLNKEKGSPINKGQFPPISHSPSPLHKDKVSPTSSPKGKNDILNLDETPSIVSSLFEKRGLKLVDGKLPKTEDIYDLNGQRQEGKKFEDLSGIFHIEWPSANLIYRGRLERGKPHGQGSFEIPQADGSVYPLLDGEFNNGAFTSGLLVKDDESYFIEGTFVNGKMNGKGTIYYFSEDDESALEYRGSFLEGKPHGKGKLYLVSSEIKLTADGEFVKGEIASGRMWRGERRYEGKFNVPADTFEGKVYIRSKEVSADYEGQCQYSSGKFHGQGKLSYVNSYTLNESEDEEEEVDALTIDEGEFRDDTLFAGKREIRWSNRSETLTIKKSKVVETMIKTEEGYTFKGKFTLGTVDGEGTIYNDQGEEVYRGQIEKGLPHGEGEYLDENGAWQKGTFENGQLVGGEDQEEE